MLQELLVQSYEESRLEYFKEQRAAAERRMQYLVNRAVKAPCYLDDVHDRAAEAGAVYSYYNDVIEMLEEKNK